LEREQQRQQAGYARRSAVDRLSALTGGAITYGSTLTVPGDALPGIDELNEMRSRPEFALYDAMRERIAAQRAAVGVETRPRVSAFARAGVGRPGLDFISDEFDAYWLGGIQVQWAPPVWGATAHEQIGRASCRERARMWVGDVSETRIRREEAVMTLLA